MNSNPKIVVFQLKELIYTVIFVILGILLILLLIFMFLPKDSDKETNAVYTPGTYTSSLTIGSVPMEIAVTVDANHINGIKLVTVGDSVTTMFPLMETSVADIEQQIVASQSLNNIYYAADNQYTYAVLMDSIKTALEKAKAID